MIKKVDKDSNAFPLPWLGATKMIKWDGWLDRILRWLDRIIEVKVELEGTKKDKKLEITRNNMRK